MASLAEKLEKARTKKKLSMNQVAQMSAEVADYDRGTITQSYISRLKSGKETNPSYLKLATLCKIYRIKPGNLF